MFVCGSNVKYYWLVNLSFKRGCRQEIDNFRWPVDVFDCYLNWVDHIKTFIRSCKAQPDCLFIPAIFSVQEVISADQAVPPAVGFVADSFIIWLPGEDSIFE